MPTLTKLFSWQEAAEHNSREDCWVVVDGKVYDVTDYLDEHPGGDDVLLRATGKDATDEFDDAGHSKEAIDLMQQYFIGEVDPTSPLPTTISNEQTSTKKEATGLTQKIMDTTLQYWVVPATVAGISVIVVGLFYLRKK